MENDAWRIRQFTTWPTNAYSGELGVFTNGLRHISFHEITRLTRTAFHDCTPLRPFVLTLFKYHIQHVLAQPSKAPLEVLKWHSDLRPILDGQDRFEVDFPTA
jgi:hypothetical protein